MRNTLTALFEYDAVPVINENDTISVDEIKFGDNDRLAAMVANLLQAPLLVILSVVDGLYRSDPGRSGEGDVIPIVASLDDEILGLAGDSKSALGTGGMRSKLEAASLVTKAGGSVIIASGKKAEPLTRILDGQAVGTLFLARGAAHGARKRWIGLTARPRGHYVVDSGRGRPWRPGRGACWRSGWSRSWATSGRGTSSASATPRAASSPAD